MAGAFHFLVLTISLLSTTTCAHLIMKSPVPFGLSTLNNSPLNNAKPGTKQSDYPCKQRTGVYDITTMNYMTVGESQLLDFTGTASHGGGTCQIAVSLDEKPTANSTFKIIQVFEGGCPTNSDGNTGTHPFTFTIPKGFPNGVSTLAWVWYNRIGDREIFMNCAPIVVKGGANDLSYYDSLPNLYLINLPTTECESGEGSNAITIPHPGQFILKQPAGQSVTAAKGPSCSANAALQTRGVTGYQSKIITTNGAMYKAPSTTVGSTGPAKATLTPASGLSKGDPTTAVHSASTSITSRVMHAPTPSTNGTTKRLHTTKSLSASATPIQPIGPKLASSSPSPVSSRTKTTTMISNHSTFTHSTTVASSRIPIPSGRGSKPCNSSSSTLQCSSDGKKFALCANGSLVWQDVAPGTRCEKSQIIRR